MRQEFISASEYIEFLARTDLGKQYPKEDFVERVTVLVRNVQISLVARNSEQRIVAVCFGLTDFAYWLFLTDLGVDRGYVRLGIAKRLMEVAHQLAGGEKRIVQCCYANDKATAFYDSGTEAARFAALRDFGLDVRVIDGPVGAASALKMS